MNSAFWVNYTQSHHFSLTLQLLLRLHPVTLQDKKKIIIKSCFSSCQLRSSLAKRHTQLNESEILSRWKNCRHLPETYAALQFGNGATASRRWLVQSISWGIGSVLNIPYVTTCVAVTCGCVGAAQGVLTGGAASQPYLSSVRFMSRSKA